MIQVELHDRTNALVQVLGGAKSASYHPVLNSDGAGSFSIHRADPDVARLSMLTGGIDGFLVHLLRMGPQDVVFTDRFAFVVESVAVQLDENEEATPWLTVAGRGTLCLLEDRMCFPPGYDGVSQSTVTNQWQVYTLKPGGQIMGGELNRSASRFALALTHSVDTTTVQQTVTLRFDNLRKLHDYLISNGMDAQMAGLDYQAKDNWGSDKSAGVRVQVSPVDSLRGVGLTRDARGVKNYVVVQGTGEGINALLRSSSDAQSITVLRRREGFVDSSQDADPVQVALRASSSVKQLKAADVRITARFTDSPATQLYRDFDLGDTIELSVPLLSIDAPYRVVGFSVADTDQEVEEVSLDLNSMRQEYLLKLATGAQLSADQLNTISRMPQGSAYNDSFGFPDSADGTFPWRVKRFIPSNVLKLNYCKLSFSLGAFRRPVQAVNNAAVTSGASSAASSAGGSSHNHSTPAHSHLLFSFVGVAAGTAASKFNYADSGGGGHTIDLAAASLQDVYTNVSGGGSTSGAEGSHTHLIPHTHTVTSNVTLIDGIFEGATATNVKVLINSVDRTVALGGPSGGFTTDQAELEIVQWLTIGAWNTFELQPDGLGRLYADVRMTGYIQSA